MKYGRQSAETVARQTQMFVVRNSTDVVSFDTVHRTATGNGGMLGTECTCGMGERSNDAFVLSRCEL